MEEKIYEQQGHIAFTLLMKFGANEFMEDSSENIIGSQSIYFQEDSGGSFLDYISMRKEELQNGLAMWSRHIFMNINQYILCQK